MKRRHSLSTALRASASTGTLRNDTQEASRDDRSSDPSPLPLGSVILDCSGPPSTDMALLLVVEDPELAAVVVGGGAAVANDGMGLLAD